MHLNLILNQIFIIVLTLQPNSNLSSTPEYDTIVLKRLALYIVFVLSINMYLDRSM
jgi:hypothetical protein